MFDPRILSREDFDLARVITGGSYERLRNPDLIIGEDGVAYLNRWHLIPRNDLGNVYFHIQTSSDPQRPEHDHPWDNTSVILSGGYDELWRPMPWLQPHYEEAASMGCVRELRKGDVVHRSASEAHRLILPPQFKYTMTLFTTGPKARDWGFWFPNGWRSHTDVLRLVNGMSEFTPEAKADE